MFTSPVTGLAASSPPSVSAQADRVITLAQAAATASRFFMDGGFLLQVANDLQYYLGLRKA